MSIFEDRKYLHLSNINYSYKNKKQQIILINSYLEMFYFIMCTLIVKYSVKSCYCCLFYVLAFQDQHTLPKWNILWKAVIVACSMYWPFRTSTPSQSEIFCLKTVIVACSMYWPFRTSTPSQSELFCLKAVIVAIGLSGPAHPPKVKYSVSKLLL